VKAKRADPDITEAEMLQLHEQFLFRQLRDALKPKSSPRTLQEIQQWVERGRMPGTLQAFSFYACCQAVGVNADNMRERVLRYLQRR